MALYVTLAERAGALLRDAEQGAEVDRHGACELGRQWLTVTGCDVAIAMLTSGDADGVRLRQLCERVLALASDGGVARTDPATGEESKRDGGGP